MSETTNTEMLQDEHEILIDPNCSYCANLVKVIDRLSAENKALKTMVANLKKTSKNSRGAGAKSKLVPEQQAELLRAYASGVSIAELAVRYQVSKGTVYKVINDAAK